jgi:hypothetical protein
LSKYAFRVESFYVTYNVKIVHYIHKLFSNITGTVDIYLQQEFRFALSLGIIYTKFTKQSIPGANIREGDKIVHVVFKYHVLGLVPDGVTFHPLSPPPYFAADVWTFQTTKPLFI